MNDHHTRWMQTMAARRVFTDRERHHDLFANADSEMREYLNSAGRRFLRTLDLVVRTVPKQARVLEIGANPYFVTAVLIHDLGLNTQCMGRPPVVWPGSPWTGRTMQARYLEVQGKSYAIDEFVCNAEREHFPFATHSFDLVIAAEILEHLIFSPTHFIYEIHRILKPGGQLLLTTPNAVQLRYLFRWFARRSVWDQYSGYGVYGRHQREYTAREVSELLEAVNFTKPYVDTYYAAPVQASAAQHALSAVYRVLSQRCPEMTFLATARGDPKVAYPTFLYRSLYPEPKDAAAMLSFANRDQPSGLDSQETKSAP